MSYGFFFESRNLARAKTFSRKSSPKAGSLSCSSSITGIREKCLMKAPPNIPAPVPHSTPDGKTIVMPRIAELGDLLLNINPQRSSFLRATSLFSAHFVIPSVWSIPVEIVTMRAFAGHRLTAWVLSVFRVRIQPPDKQVSMQNIFRGYLLCSDCAGVLHRI